ncbi:hypothetical protein PCNPT3_04540 [Psychromonas sp. CNPT3]|uniref:hypothetical protein n=1 Tax=Psychromonas sp. CNPT3 TaxID=314282 RepID=UPI00006E567E|nr:hypothetical protein [Psychromonas sp. CNPT3]AGH80850.1 hypothetical protein PCNPT3_04540 [Psychromonas sp. CNPT3]
MQHAKCTSDGKVWEALPFSQLEPSILDSKRLSLLCAECGEFAWFRKESRHGHPAHFCARHDSECNLKIEYITSDEHRDNAITEEDQVAAGDTIIVRLDQEEGGKVEVKDVLAPPREGYGEGGRTFIIKGKNRESNQQFTLRRILHRLVQSPTFRNSNSKIVFYKNAEEIMLSGQVLDIVCGFKDITKNQHDNKIMFYWGPIASAKKSSNGIVWLNSGGQYRSVSVAIFNDIVEEFLSLFDVDELEDLAGAYVLVAGRCHFTGNGEGKPVIWCGTSKYIFVRKYRSNNFQV